MTVMDYRISVLITFYNQEKCVDRALKSVMTQNTSFSYKVIIGDDGSTDATMEKIKKWENKYKDRISYIVQKREPDEKYIAGLRASRNRLALLEKVDTEYFIYLDGDDYWTDPNKLQRQYDILENPSNADCIGCAHAVISVFETEDTLREKVAIPRFIRKECKYSLQKYWRNYYFHTDTILFRSSHINDIPRDLLIDFFNDNLITFAFMQFGAMYYLPEVMGVYCKNENGIWAGEKKVISVYRDLLAYDIESKINKEIIKASSVRCNQAFRYYCTKKDEFALISDSYKELAKKYDCSAALHAAKGENLFHSNDFLDKLIIETCHIIYYFLSIKKILTKK